MATMKCPNLSTGHNMAVNGNGTHLDDVDLFGTSCWQSSGGDYIDINHKLILDSTMSSLGSPLCQDDGELEGKVTMDALDTLLNSQQLNTSLAELKPLPPFTGYTANLSINGIPGHHYHTISQRIPEENNNTYGGFGGGGGEQAIVSSSTCGMESGGGESGCGGGNNGGKYHKLDYTECVNPDSVSGAGKVFGDECGPPIADSVTAHIKTELPEYDIGSIGSIDIAAIIGSAIADTTVSGGNHQGGQDVSASANDDGNNSRDSWMDIEQWIDGACVDQHTKSLIIAQEGLSEFVMPNSNSPSEYSKNQPVEYNTGKMQQQQTGSTLQTLLTHGYMPLLQNRLQNGPPIKQEAPSSTNYGTDMISTSSPPSNVVSTTDSLLLNVNGRFLSQYGVHGLDADHRIRSPESMVGQNYPHPTTTTPATPKKPRSRAQKKQQSVGSSVLQAEQSMGVLGREKPVHRCNICNRGFLNKSNIKVHLRTHTGEKPFRCDTCAKAFRQKAHLLKHQQIHKRIGRD